MKQCQHSHSANLLISSSPNQIKNVWPLANRENKFNQRGSLLVGAIVVVAIIGMVVAYFAERHLREMRVTRGERVGNALFVLAEGVEAFVTRYEKAIKSSGSSNVQLSYSIDTATNSTPISINNLEDFNQNDITTLIQDMGLKGVSSTPPLSGANYKINITKEGTCGTTPGPDCKINTLVYIDKFIPSSDSSKPDYIATHAALQRLGRHGGMSTIDQPNYFIFNPGNQPIICTPTSAQCIANPVNAISGGGIQTGILVVKGGNYTGNSMRNYGSNYLLLDGSKAMTGDLNMGGKNIVDVDSANLSGRLSAETVFSRGNIQAAEMNSNKVRTKALQSDSITVKETLSQGNTIFERGNIYLIAPGPGTVGGITQYGGNGNLYGNSVMLKTSIYAPAARVARLDVSGGVIGFSDSHERSNHRKASTLCEFEYEAIARDEKGRLLHCIKDGRFSDYSNIVLGPNMVSKGEWRYVFPTNGS